MVNDWFNRIGQKTVITDAEGTITFDYNDKLQLISENINATFGEGSTVFNKTITRNYDMNNVKGINIGFTLQTQGVATPDMNS